MEIAVEAEGHGQTLDSLLGLTRQTLEKALTPETLAREGKELAKEVSLMRLPGLSESVARQVCDLLKVNVLEIFAGAWNDFIEMKRCARETLADPGSSAEVEVGEHEFTYGFQPSLQLVVNGTTVREYPFTVSANFEVVGMRLELAKGCVRAVRSGKLRWSATLACGATEVWRRGLGGLDLPGELRLRTPIWVAGEDVVPSERAGSTAGVA